MSRSVSKALEGKHDQCHRLVLSLFEAHVQCFLKGFANHAGSRGGSYEDMFCGHQVLSASIPLPIGESAADMIKLITMLKHVPNVAFGDFWCGATVELRERLADVAVILDAREGGVVTYAEAKAAAADVKSDSGQDEQGGKESKDSDKDEKGSKDSKDQAPATEKQSKLPLVSVPELAVQHAHSLSAARAPASSTHSLGVQREPHPVTNSTCMFCLHDRIHRLPHKFCAHRNPDLIAEEITENSMVHEQAFSQRTKAASFLRMNSAHRNMLLLRVIAHRRARQINKDNLEKLRDQLKEFERADPTRRYRLELDTLGRVVFCVA